MANILQELSKIYSEEGGEDVRAAVASACEKLGDDYSVDVSDETEIMISTSKGSIIKASIYQALYRLLYERSGVYTDGMVDILPYAPVKFPGGVVSESFCTYDSIDPSSHRKVGTTLSAANAAYLFTKEDIYDSGGTFLWGLQARTYASQPTEDVVQCLVTVDGGAFTGALIVSTDPNSVTYQTEGQTFTYMLTVQYENTTLYVASYGYWMGGILEDDYGWNAHYPVYTYTSGQYADGTLALAVLEYAGVHVIPQS